MALLLRILPVYSEEQSDPRYQIGSIRLLKHQVVTWQAINDPDVDVVFNIAMTVDGKSLAAYLPVFKDSKAAIAMYPTNELIQDQFHALPHYEERLDIRLPRNAVMYGEEITRIMRERDITVRLEAVRRLLSANFDYFVFDEFHVFGVPQIINVMDMLGYLAVNYRDKPEQRKKFVFLSATPNKLMG